MKAKAIAPIILLSLASIQQVSATTNYVLSLRSSTDYVKIPSHESLNLTTNFTLETWINPSVLTEGVDHAVVAKRRSENGTSFALRVAKGELGQYVTFAMNDGRGNNYVLNCGRIQTNTWHHVAATYDGATATIFVNGESKCTEQVALQLRKSALPVTIGQESLPGDPRAFVGLIDEVRVWSRALSQKEIELRMWQKLTGKERDLRGYWAFDDGTASDSSSLRNNGELVGRAKIVVGFQSFPRSE